jgi:hypothetical protein
MGRVRIFLCHHNTCQGELRDSQGERGPGDSDARRERQDPLFDPYSQHLSRGAQGGYRGRGGRGCDYY